MALLTISNIQQEVKTIVILLSCVVYFVNINIVFYFFIHSVILKIIFHPQENLNVLILWTSVKFQNIIKCKTAHTWLLGKTKPSFVQFQHSKVITFLHLNIYARVPPPHHFMFGLVSTFKSNDLSAHLCIPPTTPKKCQTMHQYSHIPA